MKIYKIAALCLMVPFIQAGQTSKPIDQQDKPERTVRTINNDDIIRPQDNITVEPGADWKAYVNICSEKLSKLTGADVTYDESICRLEFEWKDRSKAYQYRYMPLTRTDWEISRDGKVLTSTCRGDKDCINHNYSHGFGPRQFSNREGIPISGTKAQKEELLLCIKKLHERCKKM